MFKRIMLCYDGWHGEDAVLNRGAELAQLLSAHVSVLSIVSETAANASTAAAAVGTVCMVDYETNQRTALDECISRLKSYGLKAQGFLTRGNFIDEIAAHSRRQLIDLIVVGHLPKATGGRWWVGAQRVSLVERVNCCVLIANR